MKTKQWVQHISGQGEKWEVLAERDNEWEVKSCYRHSKYATKCYHEIPKSEYHLCDPPEEWEDITHECESFCERLTTQANATILFAVNVTVNGIYRLRKIQGTLWKPENNLHPVGWAFIIERRKS